jgi:hypothetical protein
MKLFANDRMPVPLTFSDNDKTAVGTIVLPLADMTLFIEGLSLGETSTGGIQTEKTSLTASSLNGNLIVNSLTPGTILYVYNMNGGLAYSQRVDAETQSIESLPSGVYVIVNDGRSVKATL